MNNDQSLRKHLVFLLQGEGAHVGFDSAVKDMPANLRGKRPQGSPHSAWELLEHMRIAQWDILEFTRDPKHLSPKWPDSYWPKSPEPPDEHAWDESVKGFHSDLHALEKLVSDPGTDLLASLGHDKEKTVLREVLLAADHNAYHIGELVLLRRILGAWPG